MAHAWPCRCLAREDGGKRRFHRRPSFQDGRAPADIVKVGQHFQCEFIRHTHSIADSFKGLAITTPVGWMSSRRLQVRSTAVDGELLRTSSGWPITANKVCSVFSLIHQTPSFPASTLPERAVVPDLDFATSQGRRWVDRHHLRQLGCPGFSMILGTWHEAWPQRLGACSGRSMLNGDRKARELGYIRCPDELFVPNQADP